MAAVPETRIDANSNVVHLPERSHTLKPMSNGEGAFCWPAPLSPLYPKPELWSEPQDCEITGVNGAVGRCALVSILPADKTIVVLIERASTPVLLNFSQFREIALIEPLAPQSVASREEFLDIRSSCQLPSRMAR